MTETKSEGIANVNVDYGKRFVSYRCRRCGKSFGYESPRAHPEISPRIVERIREHYREAHDVEVVAIGRWR